MPALSQLKTLYHLTLSPIRGETHQERLDSFYGAQADDYDAFRKKMLHGREALFERLPIEPGGKWLDLGAGTGRNGELFGERIAEFGSATFVDLSESLLGVAQKRIQNEGWTNAGVMHADITALDVPSDSVDLVTFTYSLTMVPDWFAAVEEALRVLKPGGVVGVADFYVARRYPDTGRSKHSFFTRNFWPFWFGMDNVHPSADHLPYLARRFETLHADEQYGKLPWIPVVRAPYYRFVGRKRID
ncbi:Ubiquinone/menaquinone biosynthesis C-methyltransferase UbiE [Pseudobythopirellula maris]|uniref:Ubiquinone/menaquinone biosynthesis C-methyltransferase UbiE n=1 Tax=Pseudobythopirellula maris TaxID=2527991 RepID=A0A5C5ZI93_9BACT|nr:methyltransferase domain-containing protein [Pseudobythopirellula maris]TWT87084.1 Ubiquinone/menaquinone biosynthesis C-methyltransferase UbiE [Pseudobythopirellula maris]